MKSLFSWLLTIFTVIFWIFRIIVAFTDTIGVNIGIKPINYNMEIILLFVTLLSIVLIFNRKPLGGIIYFVSYALYFGSDLINNITAMINTKLNMQILNSIFISAIAVILSFLTFIDVMFNRDRKGSVNDSKTRWFYKNKAYDRKLDDRADKNNYRIN